MVLSFYRSDETEICGIPKCTHGYHAYRHLNSIRCVSANMFCDKWADLPGEVDERDCKSSQCPDDMHNCYTQVCLSLSLF